MRRSGWLLKKTVRSSAPYENEVKPDQKRPLNKRARNLAVAQKSIPPPKIFSFSRSPMPFRFFGGFFFCCFKAWTEREYWRSAVHSTGPTTASSDTLGLVRIYSFVLLVTLAGPVYIVKSQTDMQAWHGIDVMGCTACNIHVNQSACVLTRKIPQRHRAGPLLQVPSRSSGFSEVWGILLPVQVWRASRLGHISGTPLSAD